MLFDEPTSALDPELVDEVSQAIEKLVYSGVTVVIAIHEIDFTREVVDSVVSMEGGKTVTSGPTKSVFGEAENVRTRNSPSTVS